MAVHKVPVESRTWASSSSAAAASAVLPPLLLVSAVIMAADFVAIELRPLKMLQIPYPKILDAFPYLVPAGCAAIWLASRRRWPNAGGIVAVLLCFTLVAMIPRCAESRVAKVPVTRWINSGEITSIETRLGVRMVEEGSSDGTFLMVAPGNEQRVRGELARLHLLGGPVGQ